MTKANDSGDLTQDVAYLRTELDGVIRRCDALYERVRALQPCPELPTSDLLTSAWSGPADVAFMVYPDPDLLETEVQDFIATAEADGGVVESVQFVMGKTEFGEFGACILYRLPMPEEGGTPSNGS